MHVVENDLGALKKNEHVRMVRLVRIDKLECDWYHIRSRACNLWAEIDFRLRWVATWLFKNFDTAMQVEHDEMAWRMTYFMPNKSIGLKSSWPSIVQIVPGRAKPSKHHLPKQDSKKSNNHPNP